MNIFFASLLECVRKSLQNVILCIIFISIFVGELIGLTVYATSQNARQNALKIIGAKIMMTSNESTDIECSINEEMMSQILTVQHVVSINQNRAEYAIPIGFKNSKETDGEPPTGSPQDKDWVDITPESVIIDAFREVKSADVFRENQVTLIEGIFPDTKNFGAIVEKRLAEVNGFHIGDVFTVTSSENIKVQIPIIGIYETKANFRVTEENSLGESIYAMSPYNRIYTDLTVAVQVYKTDITKLPLEIFVDDPKNLDIVANSIKEFDFDWNNLGLYNMTASYMRDEAGQVGVLDNFAKLIIFYVSSIGGILLLLILSVFTKYFEYESGILLALGATKKRALSQYYVTTAYIMGIALIISAAISRVYAGQLTDKMIENTSIEIDVISTYLTGFETSLEVTKASLTPTTWLMFIFTIVFFLFISGLLPLYTLSHLKPKDIITKK